MATDNKSLSTTDMAESSLSEDVDAVFAVHRRRYLLYCLYLTPTSLTLPEIADQLTVWEDPEPSDPDDRDRLRIYMSLYYDHLPALRAVDLVEYHQVDDLVEAGPALARIESQLHSRLADELPALLQAEGTHISHEDA